MLHEIPLDVERGAQLAMLREMWRAAVARVGHLQGVLRAHVFQRADSPAVHLKRPRRRPS